MEDFFKEYIHVYKKYTYMFILFMLLKYKCIKVYKCKIECYLNCYFNEAYIFIFVLYLNFFNHKFKV